MPITRVKDNTPALDVNNLGQPRTTRQWSQQLGIKTKHPALVSMFACVIRGFKEFICYVISIDVTHLKGRFKDQTLASRLEPKLGSADSFAGPSTTPRLFSIVLLFHIPAAALLARAGADRGPRLRWGLPPSQHRELARLLAHSGRRPRSAHCSSGNAEPQTSHHCCTLPPALRKTKQITSAMMHHKRCIQLSNFIVKSGKPKLLYRLPKQYFCTSFPTQNQIPLQPLLSQSEYSNLLLSATKSQSLLHGKEVHAHIIRACFRPCMFLQNIILNMYCKCGEVAIAQRLFDAMPTKDAVSWNSLITGYFQVGSCRQSLGVFIEGRSAGIRLDRFTYASALSVCSQTRDLRVGKVIHGMILVSGSCQHVFLTNSLIDMYSKCGEIGQAKLVFASSVELDDVSWNSLITAYVRVGWDEETLRTFARMHQLGMKLNSFALGSVLKSCSNLSNSVELGKMVHGCIIKVGLDSDVFAGSALIDLYAKSGFLSEAVRLFESMPDPNVVVFNSMIAGLSRLETDGNIEHNVKAVFLFSEMQRRGMRPSKYTFSSMLRTCNFLNDFELGKQIHGQVFKNDLQFDEFIGSGLIEIYSNSGSIEEGFKCFHSVPKQDIVTWTSMISGCVQTEHFERALRLFHDLLSIGIKPDQFSLSCLMSACANLAMAWSGEQIQCYAIKAGFSWFTIMNNSQIFMHARSGNIDAANQTFHEMKDRDVVSWSAMISSHAQHGCASDALRLFKEMESCQVVPNHVTFLGVLAACSHGGLVDEGLRYFESMKRDYKLDPNAKHCASIVDLLGRAGRLVDAEKFIIDSGFHDDPVLWRALLGSCRIHKNTEMGTCAAKRIMELEPHASASYVLLYNMHLDAGQKSFAMRTRDLMKERGVKKEPGLSWIEIGASVHSFVVGDTSHPESPLIYEKLKEMLSKIEKMGYIAEAVEINGSYLKQNEGVVNHHSEKLAVAFGMIHLPEQAPIRVMKNLRVCMDCHMVMKIFSASERREIVLRDPFRFHRFRGGSCSCGDYW
ncbi:pentatricopeptide repeat-containing protein [Canna indica]|uniref:Pentatricopeptide repeat-containing protein n=1 Tax=Canna indica TaxID=4628 RepID=A0AAQ3QAD3_9LILI|nr:pentatricopeptide repeat-containing protein [Canna indica]